MAREMGGWVLALVPSRSIGDRKRAAWRFVVVSSILLIVVALACAAPVVLGLASWIAAAWMAIQPWVRVRWPLGAWLVAGLAGATPAVLACLWSDGAPWILSLIFLVGTATGLLCEWIRTRDGFDDRLCDDLGQVLRAAHPYTYGHSQRVANLAAEVGRRLGVRGPGLRRLWRAGLLHDIGKLALPRSVLDKPGRLTDKERDEICRHPKIGSRIAVLASPFREVAEIILHHHERPDGKGYPDGLSGNNISLPCRILAVADAFDAMTGGQVGSERCYRPAMTQDEALGELMRHAGSQFDVRVVRTLSEVLDGGR